MAVSKLMASGLNRTAVNNSLQALKNYAVDDKGMKVREFRLLSELFPCAPKLALALSMGQES